MLSPLRNRTILSRNFTKASRTSKNIRLVVIHTMESPEANTTAESVASWFAGSSAPQASAHYCVDSDSIVGSVHEENIAWAAPGANSDGIQIELAGRAGQTAAQWNDAYSKGELMRAARLVADICRRRGIPARHLSNDGLRKGARGMIGHVQASQVYRQSDHSDPGPHFPWAEFASDVAACMSPNPRWYFRLVTKDGSVLARSKATGPAGFILLWTSFTARLAPKVAALTKAGKAPRIGVVRI